MSVADGGMDMCLRNSLNDAIKFYTIGNEWIACETRNWMHLKCISDSFYPYAYLHSYFFFIFLSRPPWARTSLSQTTYYSPLSDYFPNSTEWSRRVSFTLEKTLPPPICYACLVARGKSDEEMHSLSVCCWYARSFSLTEIAGMGFAQVCTNVAVCSSLLWGVSLKVNWEVCGWFSSLWLRECARGAAGKITFSWLN